MLEKIYAQVFNDFYKSKNDADLTVSKFTTLLKRNGHGVLLPKVLSAYQNLCDKEGMENVAILTIANKVDEQTALKELKEKLIIKDEEDLSVRYNDKLIGGYTFEKKDLRVDTSYKNNLVKLYKNMLNA